MSRLFLTSAIAILLAGCDIFDKEEMAPGFIYITAADLVTNAAEEGPATHGITDVHVFANENFVGSYELPARIAILENGPTRLNISGGVRNNGIISQRIIYPFYAPLLLNMDLIPGVVQPVADDSIAVFNYFPNAYNFLYEDFEGIGNALSSTDISDTEVIAQDEEVREGQFSGRILLNANNPVFQASTDWDLGGISLGTPAYLEIDFKGNNPLEVGFLVGESNQKVFVIGLRAQEEWTKVYIDMRPLMANFVGTQNFSIYFESQWPSNVEEVELFVDNIKFVYLQ
ncbi:MAG: hypothetical protein ABR572_09275 [Cryomorphaceae bacterium]